MKILVCDPVSPKGIALLQQRPEFEVVVLLKRIEEQELLGVVIDVVIQVRERCDEDILGHREPSVADVASQERAVKLAWIRTSTLLSRSNDQMSAAV